MKTRNIQIDNLRAIAVSLVILFHYNFHSNHLPFWNDVILNGGQLGVNIFFIISGVLISYSFFKTTYEDKKEKINLRVYFKNRVLRIFPLYWVTIILYFIFRNHIHTYRDGGCFLGWKDLIKGLFFLNDSLHVLNPVIWTLKIEIIFYLIFPFIFYLLYKVKFNFRGNIYLFFSLSFLFFFLFRLYCIYFKIVVNTNFISNTEGFLFGMFISYLLIKKGNDLYFKIIYPLALPVIILLLLCFFKENIFFGIDVFLPFFISLSNLCLFFFILGALRSKYHVVSPIVSKINRFATFIALISYSLYLVHFCVYYDIVLPIFENNKELSGSLLLMARISSIILTITISYFTYLFIERPFLKLK